MQKIITIDCHYAGLPLVAAAYLMIEGDEAAFIDNNTALAVPTLLDHLAAEGLTPEQVRYIIITHVHLDHAGGTSALLKACPNATVVAHPRAAVHVIDPARLVNSARSVYGDETFNSLYGEIEPVPAERVQEMADGETLPFGKRTLTFLHTRGHANHHFCIVDSASHSIFTGDAFGLHYPALQADGPFAFPSTSPTDFDGPLARESVKRLVSLNPSCIYPTHFGPLDEISQRGDQLVQHLEFSESLMLEAEASGASDEELEAMIRERLDAYFGQFLKDRGVTDEKLYWDLMEMDLDLNAQGLAFVAAKRRRKAREATAGG